MAKEKVAGDFREEIIEFKYQGVVYRSQIGGNFVMNDMSVTEVKDHLNDLPGRFAYWKAIAVTVEREIADREEDYEVWFAEKYQKVVAAEAKKPTETAVKNMIVLDNADEYRELRMDIRELKEISGMISALTKSYDMQSWTLRAIANLTFQELGNIEAKGHRSLADLGGK